MDLDLACDFSKKEKRFVRVVVDDNIHFSLFTGMVLVNPPPLILGEEFCFYSFWSKQADGMNKPCTQQYEEIIDWLKSSISIQRANIPEKLGTQDPLHTPDQRLQYNPE